MLNVQSELERVTQGGSQDSLTMHDAIERVSVNAHSFISQCFDFYIHRLQEFSH